MTTSEADAEIGRVARIYEQLLRKRACLLKRLERHGQRLLAVSQGLSSWEIHGKGLLDLLEKSKMDVVREDVMAMDEVERQLDQARSDMNEVGLANLVRRSGK
ncbi:MAG: hypothetical protein OXI71_14050 [Gemmatimonadota bacterium]|nr:hypothetical protein [Gemmatimonadota bacterium]